MTTKKTFAVLTAAAALIFSLSLTGNAQRQIDLGITLTNPTNGTTIAGTQAFNFGINVVNNGPDTLRATDTLVFYFTIDNSTTPVPVIVNGSGAAGDNFGSAGTLIPPNAGGPVNASIRFGTSPTVGLHALCINALVLNRSNDSVKDAVVANNKACANVTVSSTTGIAGLEHETVVSSLYPNPATTVATATLNLPIAQQVSYHILDLTGKVVATADKGVVAGGRSSLLIDVSTIPSGMYYYKIQIGNKMEVGKLQVIK